jgi:glycosyltransferase involved in cell wall biosynthesis
MAEGEAESVTLSIVVPMYNEAANVNALVSAVEAALAPLRQTYEILLVSDGATDGTWPAIVAAHARDARVRGVALSRNFGHQHALLAGYHYAQGAAVISMDGDLQHPPAKLPELYEAWQQGFKVVSTRRVDNASASLFKRLTSRYFYWFFSRLSGVALAPGSSDFRLLDRTVLDELKRVNDLDLFLRGLVTWLGFETTTITYQAAERFAGSTKYDLKRMLRFSMAAITSFSVLPLRLGIWLGFMTSGLAFVELCYIVSQYWLGHTVPGWASVMTLLSLMFGVLFILLGIIGTYLGKVYEMLKHRPRFVVSEVVGLPRYSRRPPAL